MEHQNPGESVRLAEVDPDGVHLDVPRRRQAGGRLSLAVGLGARVLDRSGLHASRLVLMACILVAPFVIAGYVGLTVLLFLPLLGLRRMFSRRSAPAVVGWDGDGPLCPGVGSLWNAATRRA